MQCSKPIFLKSRGLYVPCGLCINCRVAKSREWKQRLLCEAQYWKDSSFVTFTYDDEHLPKDFSLHPEDIQKAIKRLRYYLSRVNRKCRFFLCGEYGDQFLRPHYHALLFGVSFKDKVILEKVWDKGFVSIGMVSGDSIGYCTDYVLKKWRKGDKGHDDDPRHPPFHFQSQKLGLEYLEDNFEQISKTQTVHIGSTSGMPRYFKKKILAAKTGGLSDLLQRDLTKEQRKIIELEKQKAFNISSERNRENKEKDLEKYLYFKKQGWFDGDFDSWFRLSNRQKFLNAEGKTRMYKHKGDL